MLVVGQQYVCTIVTSVFSSMELSERTKIRMLHFFHFKWWHVFLDCDESKAFNANTMSGGRFIKSICSERIILSSNLLITKRAVKNVNNPE